MAQRRTWGSWKPVVAFISLSLAAGCSQATAPDADPLLGSWDWIDAVGGIAGVTMTPASVGYTMTVEYTMQGGGDARFTVRRNGVLFAETTVARSADSSQVKGTLVYRDPVLGWPEQEFEISGTTLILTDGCCDGFTYRFVRAPTN